MKSAVCATEVMVVAAPGEDVELCCGGGEMLEMAADKPDGASVDADAAGGTALGKRYVGNDGALEVLCTKPGEGSLAVGGQAMTLKEAKALPSSD